MQTKALMFASRYFALSTALLTASALAQEAVTTTEPMAAAAVESTLSGEVMVVNTQTRLMTIKTADGAYHVLNVPPEVTRLDEVKMGDQVNITEVATVLLELEKSPGPADIGVDSATEIDRAPGDKPAGTVTEVLTVNGKVTGVDKAGGTVTVQGPAETRTLVVEDPLLLDDIAVGDGVVATFRTVITGEVTK